MKTLFLTLLLAVGIHGQIEQVASSSDNSRGIPIAYFVDMGSIVQNKNEVTFTGFATGIKGWKDEFEIDTSEYFIVTEVWVDCSAKKYKILRQAGFDTRLVSGVPRSHVVDIPKGSIIEIAYKKICTDKKLKA